MPGVGVIALSVSRRKRHIGTVFVHGRIGELPANSSLANAPLQGTERFNALSEMLRQAVTDLTELFEQSNDVGDLSDRLDEAYETLELLYSLGRVMRDIDQPARFIVHVCHKIRETLNFGFVAMNVGKDMSLLPARTFWDGESDAGPEGYNDRDRLLNAIKDNASLNEWKDSLGAVVRSLPADYGTDAIIVAGDKQTEGGVVSSYDTKLIEAAASFSSIFLSNARLFDQQKKLFVGIVESLSAAIDAKDAYTNGHSERVAYLGEQIALNLGMSAKDAERVRICGLLHDVGKIGVPESVLCKPGHLTDVEFEHIKKHPEIGYRILKDLTGLEDVLPGVLHHHERYDGRGYPHGLKGEDIPHMARILACADTFDAMSSNRAYRNAMPREKVLAELERCKNAQFDTDVVDAFLKIDLSTYDEMVAQAKAQRKAPLAA
ncbi:MAG: HD-GYP domain-containing protein [Phycisphaera sp.]|nr:HD-GYP domain-containing protein [Phycisphaera sp.]